MNLSIIGATGNVGRKTIEILEKSDIDFDNLYLVASKKSIGKKMFFRGKSIEVELLDNYDFSKAEITFFAAGSIVSKDWAMKASKKTIVIDNSSYFRMVKDIPLVVAEVNPESLKDHKNIIANPNCSTMQMVLALKLLHDKYKINRIVVSTYQAVSGAGKKAEDELFDQTKNYLNGEKIVPKNYSKQIAFNVIPHIDTFVEDGYTKEELKMVNETKKILSNNINVTATCVRVPVKTSHAESINVEFKDLYDLDNIKKILKNTPGCKVIDEHKDGGYITPIEAEGEYKTFISRVRKDSSNTKAINLWVVSDNLLKGAALNTVQIAQLLIQNESYKN